MYPVTVTKILSAGLARYVDILIAEEFDTYPENLKNALVIENGHIKDERITEFRAKRGLFCK